MGHALAGHGIVSGCHSGSACRRLAGRLSRSFGGGVALVIVLSDVVGPICIDVIVGQPIVVNNAG